MTFCWYTSLEWAIKWKSIIMETFPSPEGGIQRGGTHNVSWLIFPYVIGLFLWYGLSNFERKKKKKEKNQKQSRITPFPFHFFLVITPWHDLNQRYSTTFHCKRRFKFSIKYFFHKFDQIPRFLRIWSHLLKRSFMKNFVFCAVFFKCKISSSRTCSSGYKAFDVRHRKHHLHTNTESGYRDIKSN